MFTKNYPRYMLVLHFHKAIIQFESAKKPCYWEEFKNITGNSYKVLNQFSTKFQVSPIRHKFICKFMLYFLSLPPIISVYEYVAKVSWPKSSFTMLGSICLDTLTGNSTSLLHPVTQCCAGGRVVQLKENYHQVKSYLQDEFPFIAIIVVLAFYLIKSPIFVF